MSGNKDKELEDPRGYGAVEYAYHLMCRAAGIAMTECRLLKNRSGIFSTVLPMNMEEYS